MISTSSVSEAEPQSQLVSSLRSISQELEPEPELDGGAALPPTIAPASSTPSAADGPEVPMRFPAAPRIPARDLGALAAEMSTKVSVPPAADAWTEQVHLPAGPQLPRRDAHLNPTTDLGQAEGSVLRAPMGGALAEQVRETTTQDVMVCTKSVRRLLEAPVVPPRDDSTSYENCGAATDGSAEVYGGRPVPPPRIGNGDVAVPPPVPPR